MRWFKIRRRPRPAPITVATAIDWNAEALKILERTRYENSP